MIKLQPNERIEYDETMSSFIVSKDVNSRVYQGKVMYVATNKDPNKSMKEITKWLTSQRYLHDEKIEPVHYLSKHRQYTNIIQLVQAARTIKCDQSRTNDLIYEWVAGCLMYLARQSDTYTCFHLGGVCRSFAMGEYDEVYKSITVLDQEVGRK